MSPRNWADCPRCAKNHEEAHAKRLAALDRAYGVVSVDEYMKMGKEASVAAGPPKETMREDYEVGVTGEKFTLSYGCTCNVCGWSFSKSLTEEVEP